ncbi:MAG: AraC family transcriptional regulator [Methylobacteriaceae bacterium]|nr:AraC family transcriptional regulator [Methylobacteriaceae bacterium]
MHVHHSAAPAELDLGASDCARFWREPRHGGLEFLSATFATHRFPLHSHDCYVVGVMLSGCNSYVHRGTRVYATPGDLCLLNPGEVHDGGPYGDGFAYRMSYPSLAVMAALAEEATGRRPCGTPSFAGTIGRDNEIAGLFRTAHERLERGSDRLAADELLLGAYGLLLLRHAGAGPAGRPGREASPIARARAYLDAHFAKDIDLSELAAVAGLSRYYFLRAFRREIGLTPHAYLLNRRVNAARILLARGTPPSQAAAACGFFDQSHLTRAFKARTGVTPGAFRGH